MKKLFEKAPAFKEVGYGITIAQNAFRALEKIDPDLSERVASAGPRNITTLMQNSRTGKTILKINPSWKESNRRYGPSRYIPMMRSKLHAELLRSIDPARVHYNSSFASFSQNDSSVVLKLEDGSEHEGTLLVGTDGIKSKVRKCLHELYPGDLGPEPPITFSNFTLWGGKCSGVTPPDQLKNTFTWAMGENESICLSLPVSATETIWSYGTVTEKPFQVLMGNEKELRDPIQPNLASWLMMRTSEYHDKTFIRDYILSTNDEDFLCWDIYELNRMGWSGRKWGMNRVTLMGDSAHAITPWTGQGAGLSIEDAYDLAYRLATQPDVEKLVKAYEKARIERTVPFKYMARSNIKSFLYTNSLAGIISRNVFRISNFFPPLLDQVVAPMYDYDFPTPSLSEFVSEESVVPPSSDSDAPPAQQQ